MKRNTYKARRSDNGEWIEGSLLNSGEEYRIATSYISNNDIKDIISVVARLIDPTTISQYTGSKDKNGNPIFENAIFKESTYNLIGIIRFGKHEKAYGFYIEWVSESAKQCRTDLLFWTEEGIEVIGNIFDNPELITRGDI